MSARSSDFRRLPQLEAPLGLRTDQLSIMGFGVGFRRKLRTLSENYLVRCEHSHQQIKLQVLGGRGHQPASSDLGRRPQQLLPPSRATRPAFPPAVCSASASRFSFCQISPGAWLPVTRSWYKCCQEEALPNKTAARCSALKSCSIISCQQLHSARKKPVIELFRISKLRQLGAALQIPIIHGQTTP